jgi:hypothetical protein
MTTIYTRHSVLKVFLLPIYCFQYLYMYVYVHVCIYACISEQCLMQFGS